MFDGGFYCVSQTLILCIDIAIENFIVIVKAENILKATSEQLKRREKESVCQIGTALSPSTKWSEKFVFTSSGAATKILACVQETRTRNEHAKEETKIKNDKNMEQARAEAVAISCDSVTLN